LRAGDARSGIRFTALALDAPARVSAAESDLTTAVPD
jgi:hypothetical protein